MLTDTPDLKVDLRPTSEVAEMIRAIDKVVSEEVQQEFEGIAQEQERVQWRMGDLTNEIWSSVLASDLRNEEGKPYTFLDVCYYVSVKYLRRSRSMNTVKAWALTARRFSPKQRDRYRWLDIPFSHFTYAGRAKFDQPNPKTSKKIWSEILDRSWELSQQQGYPASERQLREVFDPDSLPDSKPFIQYHTGVHVGTSLGFAPVVVDNPVDDVDEAEPEIDYEAELRDTLHRLHGLAQGIAVNNPKRGKVLFQALSMMWNALGNP